MSDRFQQALKRGQECPPIEVLIDSLESDAYPAIRAHSATCPGCQAEIALYRGFDSPATAVGEERDAVDFIVRRLKAKSPAGQRRSLLDRLLPPLRWTSAQSWGSFALAAAVVVLSVGLISQWRGRQIEPVAETDGTRVLRSRTIQFTTPLEDLKQAPAEIRWKAVESAASYEVRLAEVDRTVIFYNKITSNVLEVLPSLSRLMVPGKQLSLSVVARDAAGNEIGSSGATSLKIELPEQAR